MSKSVISAVKAPNNNRKKNVGSYYRSISNSRENGQDAYHHSISALPKIHNHNPNHGRGMHGLPNFRNKAQVVQKLDSTTTSFQSGTVMTFHSQYRNVRTYSNLYPNPSKGFSLPSINMKTSSIMYEKQRLEVGGELNKSQSPVGYDDSASQYRITQYNTLYKENASEEKKMPNEPRRMLQSPIGPSGPGKAHVEYKTPRKDVGIEQIHNEKTKTVVKKQFEDPISEEIDNLEFALSKAKTVNKRGYFHGNDNIILVFKSMEILMDSSGQAQTQRRRKMNPIYIPVDIVSKLFRFDTKELLKLIFDHVSFTKNANIRLDLDKLRQDISKIILGGRKDKEFLDPESGIIKTNYMSNDVDYSVTIKYPYFEYHISYKNATVIRPLITLEDFKLFFKTPILLSTEWLGYGLKCYTSFSQFNIFINGKKDNFGLSQFTSPTKSLKMKQVPVLVLPSSDETNSVYIINCKNGNLEIDQESAELESSEVLEESKTSPKKLPGAPQIPDKSLIQTSLSGFIERNSAIGKVEVNGFTLSIKGLTTDHEQRIDFPLSQWRMLLQLFKYYNEPLKIMIGNYKSSQEEMISIRKLKKVLAKYVRHAESKVKNK